MMKLFQYLEPLASYALDSFYPPKVVEARDVKFDEVAIVKTPNGRNFHMSGLVFHSGLAVSSIDARQHGDRLVVEIKIKPARLGLSGSFETDIPLSSETNQIVFGHELTPILENVGEKVQTIRTTA